MELNKNRHSVYKLNYHIVLVTKYKHKCINEELFGLISSDIHRLVDGWNGEVLKINHDCDHVHMLLSLPPQYAPSKIVCSLKTVTSRMLKKNFPEYIKNYYWKESFWSDSYLVLSVGGATSDIVKQYIEDQRSK